MRSFICFDTSNRNYIGAIALIFAFASCTHVTVKTDEHFEAVKLPDSTVVYLNQHSAIDFTKSLKNRKVTLFGEGLFQVLPGEKPFVVETILADIKVVGTEFIVKADKVEVEVEVVEGKVELITPGESIVLLKGERGVFKKSTNDLHKGKAQFRYKLWMKDLRREFKVLNKKITPGVKPFLKNQDKTVEH